MAKRITQFNHAQQDRQLDILIQLLDKEQPYKEFRNLLVSDAETDDYELVQKIQGSLIGLAVGDALGAPVEFRPNEYLKQNPVREMQSGGTWGLQAGQWTDDTSMALCLAASLIIKGKSDPYDQFTRYKRWYRNGYMSSTDKCFDIGKSTRQAITEFESRQHQVATMIVEHRKSNVDMSFPTEDMIESYFQQYNFDVKCGSLDSAGNGALMRLAPIPLFFFQSYDNVKQYIDEATQLTHGDQRAIHACQFYAGLIWYALRGKTKEQLLHPDFYQDYLKIPLHQDVLEIARGSYKTKNGYEDGIRGRGYVLDSLEAALWAFYTDGDSFEKGVLAAINLGDDTDTTAAIYGELAGAYYGIRRIPDRWVKQLFEGRFIMIVAKGLYLRGKHFDHGQQQLPWLERGEPKSYQINANNTNDHDRKTHETYIPSDNQNPGKYHTPHYDQVPSAGSTLHHQRLTDMNGKSNRSQFSNVNGIHYQEQLGSSIRAPYHRQLSSTPSMSHQNRSALPNSTTYHDRRPASASRTSHRHQSASADSRLHQGRHNDTNFTPQIKPADKVISES